MPLQKPFRGLSSVLGEFSLGQLNFELQESVSPTIEMLKWAVEPEWFKVTTTQTFTTGSNPGVLIPEDEIWLLWHIGGTLSTVVPAGEVIVWNPIYEIDQTHFIPLSDPGTFSNNVGASFTYKSEKGLWLKGGEFNQLGINILTRVGATSLTLNWAYLVSKFKV